MKYEEKTVQKNYVYKGRIIRVRNDQVILPDGNPTFREVVEHNGGVGIAALTDNNELLFVRQYRYPYSKLLLEIPAGKLELDEEPETCGIRELMEETGGVAGKMELISTVYPSPGYCGEILYIFFTRVREFKSQHLDEGEFLSVERIPLEKAFQMAMNGELPDAKTQIAVMKVHNIIHNAYGEIQN